MTRFRGARRWAALIIAAAIAGSTASACGGGGSSSSGKGAALTGLFTIAPGTCPPGSSGPPSGSYFKMVQPGGTVAAGPFVSNPDSTCADQTATPLSPGTDGGLRAGGYQSEPTPPFAAKGNSTSAAVIQPQGFFGVQFGVSTNRHDPQSGATVPAPTVTRSGSTLSADLSAWSVSWNGQQFNQGAPKPGGPGSRATGTYDAASGGYSLSWTSPVKGGPFNGFTGVWHLDGRVQVPA